MRMPPLEIGSTPDMRPPLLVYTDASFSWRDKRQRECGEIRQTTRYLSRSDPMPEPWRFNGELGAIVYDPEDGFMASAEGRPDAELVAYYVKRERRTYIAQLETLAAMAPYTTWPERFAGRRVMHFIDNTVALSSLVHGYARQTDMAEMVTSGNSS